MKMNKKIIMILLCLCFLTGCYNKSEIRENKIIITDMNIKDEKKLGDSQKLSKEEVVKLIKSALKKYYLIDLAGKKIESNIKYISKEDVDREVEIMDIERYLKLKLEFDLISENGYYFADIVWYTGKFRNGCFAKIEGGSGEILELFIYGREKKNNTKITKDQIQNLAEEFIIENNFIEKDEIVEFSQMDYNWDAKYPKAYFLYENKNDVKNKVFLIIDAAQGEIFQFTKNEMNILDSYNYELIKKMKKE